MLLTDNLHANQVKLVKNIWRCWCCWIIDPITKTKRRLTRAQQRLKLEPDKSYNIVVNFSARQLHSALQGVPAALDRVGRVRLNISDSTQ